MGMFKSSIKAPCIRPQILQSLGIGTIIIGTNCPGGTTGWGLEEEVGQAQADVVICMIPPPMKLDLVQRTAVPRHLR